MFTSLLIHRTALLGFVALGITACSGGSSSKGGGGPALDQTGLPYNAGIQASDFSDPTTITNAYLPLIPGTTSTWRAETDEGVVVLERRILGDTVTIMGIECLVVHEIEYLDGEISEETDDWFAQDDSGRVWYFGEDTVSYDDGVADSAGSWQAGSDGAQPGIVMQAPPLIGQRYFQEYYAGEAEDTAEVVELDASLTVPFAAFDGLLVIEETTPLEPDVFELKYYADGVGFIAAEKPDDDEVEALVSVVEPGVAPSFDATAFSDPTTITNPYLPLLPGNVWVYQKTVDGETEQITITVTDETKTVMGITCVVVEDVATVDGEVEESTEDWYAQDDDGNVWYFGEFTTSYDDGEASTEGSWEAGVGGAEPGIVMWGEPEPGVAYRLEYLAGEAEDMATLLFDEVELTVDGEDYSDVIQTHEWSPLDPALSEYKFYAEGVGMVREMERDDEVPTDLVSFTSAIIGDS